MIQKTAGSTGFILLTLLIACCSCLQDADYFYGINYGAKRYDGDCPTYDQVLADVRILQQHTNIVRIYSLVECNIGELVLKATQSFGMKLFAGLSPLPNQTFEAEKETLMYLDAAYGLNNLVAVSVGSEALYRGDLTPEELAEKIYDVKGLLQLHLNHTHIPVTTADVYFKIEEPVISAVDFCLMNAFSYWEGVTAENGTDTLFSHIYALQKRCCGKVVAVGETGWPSGGVAFGDAVPNMENMQTYLNGVICRAHAEHVPIFWFEIFDELWKAAGVEQNWGLYNYDREPKPGVKLQCPEETASVKGWRLNFIPPVIQDEAPEEE